VQELGGKILMPPFDTPGVARTAVVADPEGAVFGRWEDRGKPGAEVQERTGSMWWVELLTADRAAARSFYADLFAWTSGETLKYETPSPYVIFKAGEASAGGASQTEPGWNMKPSWQVTFAIDDYHTVVRRAEALGAGMIFHREVPDTGRLAILIDPSDALFYIMHPKVIVP
jgi:predicted enzyme related to lactoylglutathione lyase